MGISKQNFKSLPSTASWTWLKTKTKLLALAGVAQWIERGL